MLVNVTSSEIAIGIDAAVAQKWPVGSLRVESAEIGFDNQNFFLIDGAFLQDHSRWISHETLAPELDAVATFW